MAVLVAAWLVAGVAAAPRASASGCPDANGVTVVVDFGSLGGGISVRCAAGRPVSGLAALDAAGFSVAFVPGQFGFVCQINGLPKPCNGAPPGAYWAYWHGKPGGSWSYSNQGAGSYTPPPGSVEGWAFGAGRAPGIAPPALPAPPPPPPTTTRATTRPPAPAPSTSTARARPSAAPGNPAPPGGATATGSAGSGGGKTAGAATPVPSSTGRAASGGAATSAGVSPTAGGTTGAAHAGAVTGQTRPAADSGAGGISPGLVIGVALIAALAATALLIRRRQARGSP